MRKILWLAVIGLVLLTGCTASDTPQIFLDETPVTQLTVFVGQQLQLSCSPGDCRWASSDAAVEIAQDGFLQARGEGTATVTATKGKLSASVTVTVTPYIPVTQLEIDESITVKAGVPKELSIRVLPENASDPSLRFEVSPEDGAVQIEDNVVSIAESVAPGTVYEVTAVNDRSALFCTFKLEVSDLKGLTAWTIGDSIFDFRDNSDTDMVQTVLKESGYTNFCMDNIAGSTVRAASSVGIIEHLDSGMYDSWPEPELILIFRGTNDAYYSVQQPGFFTQESVEEAIRDTCRRLRQMHPQARIVWATPIWRLDVSQERMDWLRQCLLTTCPEYDIEVFELHLAENFKDLSHENFGATLNDGIHLTDMGAQLMKEAFIGYLTGK